MCGIIAWITDNKELRNTDKWSELVQEINKRGPTHRRTEVLDIPNKLYGYFHSSVLSMRPPLIGQPLNHDDGLLQYNGELYNDAIEFENDTEYVFRNFVEKGVLKSVARFRGEYAFVYYDKKKHQIWFGRDPIGRRSLLYCIKERSLVISSLALDKNTNWIEVPARKILCYDLMTSTMGHYEWSYHPDSVLVYPYSLISKSEHTSSPDISEKLYDFLFKAVQRRLMNIPHIDQSNAANVAILFSGGLDCTLLAYMADKILPMGAKIDLLNVAFENPRTGGGYNTPDRKLGRLSWSELISAAHDPSRYRFIEINIPYSETLGHRPIVEGLMCPKETVMDLSIAVAFYFASRGKGDLYHDPRASESSNSGYLSSAKVLVSGLGADELFGGYTRHSTTLRRENYQSLALDLQKDFDRLDDRNLGRDDRVCSCWGKEVRYPFLDEEVVEFAMKCGLHEKVRWKENCYTNGNDARNDDKSGCETDMNDSSENSIDRSSKPQSKAAEKSVISKFILREIAKNHKLYNVSKENKRAIQFGAKTAKMEIGSSKVKGQDLLDKRHEKS